MFKAVQGCILKPVPGAVFVSHRNQIFSKQSGVHIYILLGVEIRLVALGHSNFFTCTSL